MYGVESMASKIAEVISAEDNENEHGQKTDISGEEGSLGKMTTFGFSFSYLYFSFF